jgi:hypothetical protein
LADLVSEEDLGKGSLYPPLNTIQNCSLKIAARVAEYAYKHGALDESFCMDIVAGIHARTLLKYNFITFCLHWQWYGLITSIWCVKKKWSAE